MDKTTREFIGFTKAVLAELRALSSNLLGVQKQVEIIAKEQKAKNEREKSPPTERLHQVARWDRFKKWFFEITVAEAGMLLLTGAILGSTIMYTIYAHHQWRVMSGQLTQMQVDSRTSDQHFLDTLTQMKTQSGALVNIASAAGTIAGGNVSSPSKPVVTANVSSPSKPVVTASVGVIRINIGEDHPRQDVPLGEISPNVPITANVVLKNLSQFPIYLDDLGMKIEVRSDPVPENFQYGTTIHRNQMTIPQDQEFMTTNAPDTIIRPDEFSAVRDFITLKSATNNKRLVFHGIVRYHDQSQIDITTKFCFLWNGVDRLMNNCFEHNGTRYGNIEER